MEDYINYFFRIDPQTLKQLSQETARTFALFHRATYYLQAKLDYHSEGNLSFNSFRFGAVMLEEQMRELSEENIPFLQQTAELLYS